MRSLLLVAVLASAASAAPMTVSGEVTSAESRWTSDGTRIITDAHVLTPDGIVVVSQLGGTVGGLTMRMFPGPEILEPGMRVDVIAHRARDLEQREHVVLDSVKVTARRSEFVRTGPTKAGNSLYWESGCAFITIDEAGTKEIPGDQEFPVIDASIATWNDSTPSCSKFKIVSDGRAAHEVGKDNVNVLKFRDSSWCRPAIKDDPARCYSSSAAGLTTATYVDDASSDRDGAIVDADIELNGVDFAISVNGVTLGTASCNADLANTLTHELGHFHGLEHVCLATGDPPRVDGNGAAVPRCSSTSDPRILEATMYNFQDCGETKKATLEPDDIAGKCGTYPTANDPGTCEHVSIGRSGCCSAQTRPEGALVLTALTALLVFRRRQKLDR